MKSSEQIIRELETLPPSAQGEVLDFIGYLKLKKTEHSKATEEWTRFSIKSALRGLEDDLFPEYGEADFKEVWK